MSTSDAQAPATSPGVLPLVLQRACTAPQALAVHDGDVALTYGGLVAAAREFAHLLRARGVGSGSAVGLLMPHSPRALVSQLAVWWAGGHFVPLDANYPIARTRLMLETAGAELVVGDQNLAVAAGVETSEFLASPELADLHGTSASRPPEADDLLPGPSGPDPLAYVMYTSGSSGRPKGVALTHRGIAVLIDRPEYLTLTERDRVLLHSPMTFDASAFETWAPLANGAAVVISNAPQLSLDALVRDAEELGTTVAFFTTALFHHLVSHASPLFRLLRTVLVGGEALSGEHARNVLRSHPWLELINVYGPTEATTFATAHRVREGDCDGPPPIGRPTAKATAQVLDEHGQPVPTGAVGELWIGGPRLAREYLGQPELTAERFVDRPGEGRWYRTGDLVSQRADGVIDFHGRVDDQVKLRGFRIEPGEIEHGLRAHPDVADAAVVVRRPSRDDAHLAAVVVPRAGRGVDAALLRDHLKEHLPPHLIPNTWTSVSALPLTGSGKVDRRALVEVLAPSTTTANAAANGPVADPGSDAAEDGLSPIEQAVADLWSRALDTPVTRRDADFLALGGHSLLALGILEDLRGELGVALTLVEFFAAATLADHAELIEQALMRDTSGRVDAESD
ncbi:amino acid adenylation domain-containing protein [Streptomyces sp. NPDC059076]|uniref:amino acid adenylation domain-containing protein n=1 Tax=unclassified Streptomyces TaxID=2593676 RepID=UPI0036A4F81F